MSPLAKQLKLDSNRTINIYRVESIGNNIYIGEHLDTDEYILWEEIEEKLNFIFLSQQEMVRLQYYFMSKVG